MKASKSIKTKFKVDAEKKFQILGRRPPSLFSNNDQGDHVTPYAFIEDGIERIFDDMSEMEFK